MAGSILAAIGKAAQEAPPSPTALAAQAIGECPRSPDDLVKIPAFRKRLEKEKASIDIRLKSGVKEQLSVTSESLRKLFSTCENVQVITDEMVTVDRICSNPQNVVLTLTKSVVCVISSSPVLNVLINL
jgi:hypothetical protein